MVKLENPDVNNFLKSVSEDILDNNSEYSSDDEISHDIPDEIISNVETSIDNTKNAVNDNLYQEEKVA
jgi:hypothetical protein